MKRIVIIVLGVWCWMLGAGAQNMKVLDFKLLENDLTANTRGTQKLDMNGETAALIKIQTPERGFSFDGGMQGIVASEEHAGEIWLYLPRRAQKLIIQHPDYGVLRNYYYPINIEGGKTYEMLIDIGTGRYATITSGVAKANIIIDGDDCGISPVRKYLNYGRHTIKAVKDHFEGETTAVITTNESQQLTANNQQLIHVEMQDMSHLYGDVTVTVDNRADIFYNGQNMGTGIWQTQLREGSYTIEARKANSDPALTSFVVKARQMNEVKANAPVPHTGWLHVYTRPRNVKITPIDVSETQTLAVGTYQLEFTRKGFVTQNKEYTVRRNETTLDTVTLQRVTYVKPLAFYFGGGFTLRSLSGISAIVGAVYQLARASQRSHYRKQTVAFLQFTQSQGAIADHLIHYVNTFSFMMDVANCQRHTLAFVVRYNYNKLPRLSAFGNPGSVYFHQINPVAVQQLFLQYCIHIIPCFKVQRYE